MSENTDLRKKIVKVKSGDEEIGMTCAIFDRV